MLNIIFVAGSVSCIISFSKKSFIWASALTSFASTFSATFLSFLDLAIFLSTAFVDTVSILYYSIILKIKLRGLNQL